jgi:hypothetical protein
MPSGYASLLRDIKQRIQQGRLQTVLAANSAMVLLYWDIGRAILERQGQEGWGAKVIDRLATDLRRAFPDMRGLSPRNLKYMRAFAAAWTDRSIVQEVLAQIPWFHNIAMPPSKPTRRSWDMATRRRPAPTVAPCNIWRVRAFYVTRSGPQKKLPQAVAGLLLGHNILLLEAKPIGVAEWETKIVETLPENLKGSLPTVEEIEAELAEVSDDALRTPRRKR